jgi:hypothetical protein
MHAYLRISFRLSLCDHAYLFFFCKIYSLALYVCNQAEAAAQSAEEELKIVRDELVRVWLCVFL